MKKMITIALIAVLTVVGTSQAALITHDANIDTDNLGSLLQNEGTLVQAENYAGVAVTVAGIDFAAGTALLGWGTTSDYAGTDATINLLVNTQYSKNYVVKTVEKITGLTVGQKYRVQLLAGEDWLGMTATFNLAGTAPEATGNSVTITDDARGLDLLTFEFVAAGDTLEIQMGGAGDPDYAQLAGYAVHEISESPTLELDVVSLNFHKFAGDVQKVLSPWGAESAGGWNNVQTDKSGTDLLYSDGTASTIDFVLAVDTDPKNLISGAAANDGTAFKSYYSVFLGGASLSLAQIGGTFKLSDGYDVYVYFSNTIALGTISDGSTVINYTGSGVTPALDDATTDGTGNYVKFSGLTADTLNLSMAKVSGTGAAAIAGIQIVGTAVPPLEPELRLYIIH